MGRLLKNHIDTSWLKKIPDFSPPVLLLGIAILCAIGLKLHLVVLSMPFLWAERLFFAALALLSMIFMGMVVFRIYGERFLLFLVPLILILTGSYLNFSQQYLNVTIIDSFLVALLYLYLFFFIPKDTICYRVFVPGILSGITLAANHDLFPLVLPSILVILFYSRKKRTVKILLLISVTLVTLFLMIPLSFFIFVPFNILDFKTYSIHLKDSVFQVDGLFYWRTLLRDFGIGSLIFVFLGLVTVFKKDWKRALILISFPFIFLVYMNTQRPRIAPLPDVLILYPFYSIFTAVGILGLYFLLKKMSGSLLPLKISQVLKQAIILLIVSILFFSLFPVTRAVRQWGDAKPDSRNQAIKWIRANIQRGATLVVPGELEMDIKSLQKDYLVFSRDFKNLKKKTFENLAIILDNPFFLVPEYNCYGKDPVKEKDLKILEEFKGKIEKNAHFGTNKVLCNYYCPLPSGDPRFSIGKMKGEPVKPIDKFVIWNPKAESIQDTSPSIITLFTKGEFSFHFTRDKMGNILEVRNRKSDKEGNREVVFGYEVNRNGFEMEIPGDKYIHLVVNAAILPLLKGSKKNFVYISDFSGESESEKVFLSSPGWRTYIVSRKLCQGTDRLVLGFKFNPRSEEDRLKIRHINIFLFDQPL